jgi:transcriptional regulator with AAA-type ATPase domain
VRFALADRLTVADRVALAHGIAVLKDVLFGRPVAPEEDRHATKAAITIVRSGTHEQVAELVSALGETPSTISPAGRAKIEIVLAHLALREGNADELLSRALLGRLMALAAGNESDVSICCGLAGTANLRSGRYEEAKQNYEEALVAARRACDLRQEATALSNLGLVAKNSGHLLLAEDLLRQALEAYSKEGSDADRARCQLNLGIVLGKRSRIGEAKETLTQALIVFEESGMPAFVVSARIALGRLYRLEGRVEDSRTYLEEALRESELIQNPRLTVIAREYLGDLALDRGDAEVARHLLSAALENARRISRSGDIVVECLYRLAEAELLAGSNQSSAQELAKEAMTLAREQGDPYELASSLSVAGRNCARLGDLAAARELLKEALDLWRSLGDRFEYGRAAHWLSRVYAESNQHMDALGLAMEAKRELGSLSASRWAAEADDWFTQLSASIASRVGPHPVVDDQRPEAPSFILPGYLTRDSGVRRILHTVGKLAPRSLNILVLGESGTGKELVAKAIHEASGRKGPFVPVNCSALPGDLLEAELFGHSRGAYTGADRERGGLIEHANRGTLFLDEIGDMPLKAQARLLRALESGEIRRLGENTPRMVDVRVVSATHRDLLEMVSGGEFRLDLYYRLAGYVLRLPPVRERDGDAALLVDHFFKLFCEEQDKAVRLTSEARQRLIHYSWPGNVREIRNVVHRIVSLAEHGQVVREFDFDLEGSPKPRTLPEVLEAEEKKRILDALRAHNWNRTKAAHALGSNRTTLIGKMKRLGILQPGAATESSETPPTLDLDSS